MSLIKPKKLLDNWSLHRRVAKNMMFVGVFLLIGKFAGAGKEMAIAYRFGVSEIVDTYVLAYTVAMWIPAIWMSVATSTLVPLTNSNKDEKNSQFHSELSGWLAVASGIILFISIIFIPFLIPSIEDSFGEFDGLEVLLISLVVVGFITMFIVHYNTLLLVQEKHLNTLLNGVPALVIMISVLMLSDNSNTNSLAFGAVLGVLLHCVILLFLLRKSPLLGKPKWSFKSSSWVNFKSALSIMFFSTIIINVTPVIDQFTAASLGVGSVSKLGYSTRLLSLLLGLGAISIARSILPVLSKQSDSAIQIDLTERWFLFLFAIGCVVLICGWILAPQLVTLVYQRGAFTAADSESVFTVLRMGLIQIPFYFSGIVLVQFFTSRKRFWVLFSSSCVALVAKLSTVFILSSTMGIEGIALSTGLMYVGTFVFLVAIFAREKRVLKDMQ